MFAVTIINFLLSNLTVGNRVAGFIVYIRKALILNIEHPLPERQGLVHNDIALQNMTIIAFWSENLPVSSNLPLLECVFKSSCSVEIVFSDIVVIWRAWIIFQDRQAEQRLILIPFMLWIAAVGE